MPAPCGAERSVSAWQVVRVLLVAYPAAGAYLAGALGEALVGVVLLLTGI